jgi:uncharacterized OB-fold protein
MDAGLTENRIPVIKGWIDMKTEDYHLIGNRCKVCGEHFFPKAWICRNPDCNFDKLEDIPISKRGTIWSHTLNFYEPPAPYVPPKEFEPYATVVVELPKEKLMIMGPLADGCDYAEIKIGMEVEMIFETLHPDDEGKEQIIWKWKPVSQME